MGGKFTPKSAEWALSSLHSAALYCVTDRVCLCVCVCPKQCLSDRSDLGQPLQFSSLSRMGGDIEQGDKKKHSRRTTEVQTKGWPIYLCTPSVDSLTFLFSTSRREGRDKEKEQERGRRLGERCCYLRLVLRWILLMSSTKVWLKGSCYLFGHPWLLFDVFLLNGYQSSHAGFYLQHIN